MQKWMVTKETKLKDVLKTPAGHDILAKAFYSLGLSEKILTATPLGSLKINSLKKLSFGKLDDGFINALLGLLNSETERPLDDHTPIVHKWWKEAVFYQIYPRSFKDSDGDGIGDINGIIEKLDYLKALGVDAIWCSPVYDSPNDDNGYDIRDYRKIMREFGTMEDFDRLLSEVHARNMRLIMDLVINHSSDEHEWFRSSATDPDSPYRDFYIWRKGKGDGIPPNNWDSIFSGPAWNYYPERGEWAMHLFSSKQMDFNWDNEAVRKELFQIANWWLEKGIDGFRMDVITLISKDPAYPDGPVIQNKAYGSYYAGCASGPRVHEYLQEMNREVLSKYDIMTVGEAPHTSADEAAPYTASDRHELNMVFHFDHMHLDYDENGKYAKNRVKLTDLKEVMTKWQDTMHECDGWNSLYWSNHDQARAVSRFGNESEPYRVKSAKMLGTILHMMQGTPYIYEGEELGMTNAHFESIDEYKDVEALDIFRDFTERKGFSEKDTLELLGLKSRDNARTPMQWDNTVNAGFTEGTPWIGVNKNCKEINVEQCLADQDSIFYYYQKLIQLRHEMPIITDGVYELLDKENESVYAYLRKGEKETLLVVGNFTDKTINYHIEEKVQAKKSRLLISNYNAAETFERDLSLEPYGACVYLLEAEK